MRARFFVLFFSITFLTQASVDSLWSAAQAENNLATKAGILMQLGYELEFIDVDSALAVYNRAKTLSLKANDYKLAGKVCLNQSFGYFYGKQDAVSAIKVTQEAIPYYEATKHDTGLVQAYYNLGFYYSELNDYANSIISYKTALEYEGVVDHDPMFGKIYSNLGYVYQELGALEQVIEHSLKSIEIKKRTKDPTVYTGLINLAISYYRMQNYRESEKILRYCLANDTINTFEGSKGPAYVNLASIYFNEGNLDSALYYNALGLQFFDEIGFETKITSTKAQRAEFLVNKNLSDQAISLLTAELSRVVNTANLDGLFQIHSGLTQAYLKIGNKKLALVHAKSSYQLGRKINSPTTLAKGASLLSNGFKLNGRLDSALHYAELHIAMQDTVEQMQKIQASANMQALYNTQEKEKEILQLSKDKIKTEANLAQANRLQRLQLIILGLMGLGAIIIGLALIQNRKSKKQIELANTQLISQNEIITKQNQEKELLLKEIHHRVKNNLQIISSLLKLQSRNLTDEKTKAAVDEGQNRVKSMALIHQMLYQTDNVSAIKMAEYIPKLTSEIQQGLSTSKQIHFEFNIDESLQLDIDTAIPLGLILTELLTNIYKYAFRESDEANNASIKLEKENSKLTLQVSDNGVGLPEGLDIKKAKTLGLRLINNLTRQLNGTLSLNSKTKTNFIIQIPV